jgi:hypothetical protein
LPDTKTRVGENGIDAAGNVFSEITLLLEFSPDTIENLKEEDKQNKANMINNNHIY